MEYGMRTFKILTCKSTGNRPLARPIYRFEDNIRMDLKEIGVSMGNLIILSQDRDSWRVHEYAALNLEFR